MSIPASDTAATLVAVDAHLTGLRGARTAGSARADGATPALPPTRLCVLLRSCALLVCAAVVAVGCIPSNDGTASEVDDGTDSAAPQRSAPEFPEQGVVPDTLLVEGLRFDLTERPADPDFWTPPGDEAECTAERIVETVGAERLSELGYRPGTPGASVNDLALSEAERTAVVDAVVDCVDMSEAVGAMFFGNGRIPATVASCLADGLGDKELLRPFAVAIVFGAAVDPFTDDAVLATAILDQSVVCVPDRAFNWSDLTLPDGSAVQDSDRPGGTPGSPYLDDQLVPTSTTAP